MAWILCAIRKVSLRVARGVLAGVGRGGDLVCRRLGGGGIWAPPFPTLLAAGALATTGKKLTERHLFNFYITNLSIIYYIDKI